jgi:hypothetical protein
MSTGLNLPRGDNIDVLSDNDTMADSFSDMDTAQEGSGSVSRYREIVGSLMYLMVSTRPDLAYSVSYLARYLSHHDQRHMSAAYQVLRYLRSTTNVGITFDSASALQLIGYSDSDWASCTETRRSTTGFIFFLSGGPISWKSKLQPTVALSSSEAEYMALSTAAQEAIALQALLADFGVNYDSGVTIYEDNTGAEAMAKNASHYSKTKHIHIRYHFIRELVSRGQIVVERMSTENMLADILTKALPTTRFIALLPAILGRSHAVE